MQGQARDASVDIPTADALASNERVRIMRDGVLNNASLIVSGAIGIALVPVLLRGLGSASYGIWIAALSIAGTASLFDFGLGMSTTREVVRSLHSEHDSGSAEFVQAAGLLFLLIGFLGALVIAVFGIPLSRGLHLSATNKTLATAVFALAGASFFADRQLAFGTAVLRGIRRFDAINLVTTLAALARALGIYALIKAGSSVVAIMGWQAVTVACSALASLWCAARLQNSFNIYALQFDWALVRGRAAFSLASQLITVFEVLIWDIAPVVVGLVLGVQWIVPYYVAQQFPTSVGPILWSTAEALFPAVSQHEAKGDMARSRDILLLGTRWIVVIALPLCLGLSLVGPKLLQAWLGVVPTGSVTILRLVTLAVFMEGFSAASIQVLWGYGKLRALVTVPICLLITSLTLTLYLLPRYGVVGAAWGLAIPMVVASLIYIAIGANTCALSVSRLMTNTFATLLLPALILAILCVCVDRFTGPGWGAVLLASGLAGTGYIASLLLFGARPEERLLVRRGLSALYQIYRWVRHGLARIGFLKSTFYLFVSLREAMMDSTQRGTAELDRDFESSEDPWNYSSAQFQVDRIRHEVDLLRAVCPAGGFKSALEIGCAEGLFTEQLAPLCTHLIAADISALALKRTEGRLRSQPQVEFALMDIRRDSLPAGCDLMVIIHALEYIRNPLKIRQARVRLVDSLQPGGHLLIGTMQVSEMLENAWWARFMLRSGKQINRFFAAHPLLETVRTETVHLGPKYVAYDILLRKKT